MYIKEFKTQFYNILNHKRIHIFVNFDLDAICACKIIQYLFRCDSISYTLISVNGKTELIDAYNENKEEVKTGLFLNCGGTLDLLTTLEPDDDVSFYILDAHRPTDICNIYSEQVKILCAPDDDEEIPPFEELFRDESEDEDDEEHGRIDEETLLRRRDKRLWLEKRDQLMFKYQQYSYYGTPISLVSFEMAWKLAKDSLELLWCAVVGVTDNYILEKTTRDQYFNNMTALQSHMNRLEQLQADHAAHGQHIFHITWARDLKLALYRHWTVENSIKTTVFSCCPLKMFTLNGTKKLQGLLAEMGLPLIESQQLYSSMDLSLRKEFFAQLSTVGQRYDLDDLVFGSFTLCHGFKYRYCALDFVYAMLGLLENSGLSSDDAFSRTLDALSRSRHYLLEEGLEKSKNMLLSIYKQVQMCLELRLVRSAGPFIYTILQEVSSIDNAALFRPHCLGLLARFLLHAYQVSSRNPSQVSALPLVIVSPPLAGSIGDYDGFLCLVLGIPPLLDDSMKNLFGSAFERTAEKSKSIMLPDNADSSLVKLKKEDVTKFLDTLTTILM